MSSWTAGIGKAVKGGSMKDGEIIQQFRNACLVKLLWQVVSGTGKFTATMKGKPNDHHYEPNGRAIEYAALAARQIGTIQKLIIFI